jgi:hypothetical protein
MEQYINIPDLLPCLLYASLPETYLDPDIAKVLVFTKQLVTNTLNRIEMTNNWIMSILEDLSALQKYGLNQAYLLGSTHQGVESNFLQHFEPKQCVGLHQVALAYTLLTFSYVPIESARRRGEDLPDKNVQDVLPMWNLIGSLLGVDPEGMPSTINEAKELIKLIRDFVIQEQPDKNTQALANAFVQVVNFPMESKTGITEYGGDELLKQLGVA